MRLFAWTTLLVLLVVQAWGLYAPAEQAPGVPGTDKIAHLAGFAAPAALAWWLGARRLVALMLVHALASEWLQQLLAPSRMLDWRDTVANLLGLAVGVALAGTMRRLSGQNGGMPPTTEDRR